MASEHNSYRPLVSILITNYNRAKWIGQAIESAMAQDYENLEIIVSDDASTDNSDEVIRAFTNDPRVKYTRQEKNIGMIANFNKTFFELAKGKYVTQLGSDDFLTNPGFISKAVDVINKYEDVCLVFGRTSFIDQHSNVRTTAVKKEGYEVGFRKGKDAFFDVADNPYVYYTSGAVVYDNDKLKQHRIFFEGRITADIELNLQMMLYGNVGFIDEQIYAIRQHASNASSSFKNLEELEFSYLDLIRVLYSKAKKSFGESAELDEWYEKTFRRSLERCFYMVLEKKDRKLTINFHKILMKKYRRDYFSFLSRHPKFVIKLLLNK